jgi:hypothetical protein
VISARSGTASSRPGRDGGNGRLSSYRTRSATELEGNDYQSGENLYQRGYERGARARVRSAARNVKGKLSDSMHAVQERTGEARSNFTNLVQQQPVALGALALAAGALLGAALPMTEYENRLIGPVHDRTLARAKEVGERQYENIKQAVASSTNGSNGGGQSGASMEG